MFPLTDKKEKEKKIDPERVDKVPKYGTESKTQMILNRVAMLQIFVNDTDQDDYPRKDVQQVRPCDHVQKRRSHIALRTRRVQSCLDELVESVELIEDKGQAQNQGQAQKQVGPGVISRKQGSPGQDKRHAAQKNQDRAEVKSGGQLKAHPVFSCPADNIGAGQSGKHHGHADHGDPEHLFESPFLNFLFHLHQ